MSTQASLKRKATLLAKVLGSNWFFSFVVVFFLFQTIWIALSNIYPMIFDEEYHLGIIDIYSRQISPFISTQPPEASFHGDITRYGSYLFHYVMSAPYALISTFTSDIHLTVILMRLICIGFVVAGLFVFRAFLIRSGLTKSLTHLSIAFFTLIPLVPFALSQINYDSLAFLLTASIFYLAIRSIEKNDKQIFWIILLLSTSSLASLVKFTILPIAFSCVLFVFIILWRKNKNKTLEILVKQAKKLPKAKLIIASLFFIFSLGMFVERYGTNIVQYRALEPKCDQVHSEESCVEYTVWRRDTSWKQSNDAKNLQRDNPIEYTTTYWAPHIFNDFFVTASFVYDKNMPLEIRHLPTTMQASGGNPILKYAGWIMLPISIIVLALSWRKLPLRGFRNLILMTVLIYATSLWLRNYSDYLNIGAGTAAQGRYFIPLLIPIFAVVGLGFRHYLKRIRHQVSFLFICLLIFSQGGGVMNYMLYSNSRWYWSDSRTTITNFNKSTQKFLRTFIRL